MSNEKPRHLYAFDTPHIEPSPRWVRVKLGGEFIADCREPMLHIQYGKGMLPTYFFPQDAVRMERLTPSRERDGKRFWTIDAGEKPAVNAAWAYLDPSGDLAELHGHLTFLWHKMDAWYEEEEQVFVHARDPYKRVDVLPSSRHVRVVIGGEVIADSSRPHLLFETNLPTRYYLPKEDIRIAFLTPTETTSRCPYKGVAEYWSVTAGEKTLRDVAWSYPNPIPENPKIDGLVCFYNERVDLYVDGELQPRPVTPWS